MRVCVGGVRKRRSCVFGKAGKKVHLFYFLGRIILIFPTFARIAGEKRRRAGVCFVYLLIALEVRVRVCACGWVEVEEEAACGECSEFGEHSS